MGEVNCYISSFNGSNEVNIELDIVRQRYNCNQDSVCNRRGNDVRKPRICSVYHFETFGTPQDQRFLYCNLLYSFSVYDSDAHHRGRVLHILASNIRLGIRIHK